VLCSLVNTRAKGVQAATGLDLFVPLMPESMPEQESAGFVFIDQVRLLP